ncbi:MAG: hypothetical protein ACPL4H_09420 [Anaerolineales bacterium]
MRKINRISFVVLFLFLTSLACSLFPSAVATPNSGAVYTQAVETVVAKLTENAFATQVIPSPSETMNEVTPQNTSTETPTLTNT